MRNREAEGRGGTHLPQAGGRARGGGHVWGRCACARQDPDVCVPGGSAAPPRPEQWRGGFGTSAVLVAARCCRPSATSVGGLGSGLDLAGPGVAMVMGTRGGEAGRWRLTQAR